MITECTLAKWTLGPGTVIGPPSVGTSRDRDPVAGELTHERVHHFPGRFACDK